MQVNTRKAGPVTILDVSGEIDFANSPLFRSFLIDSSGVASLVDGLKVSRDVGCRFLLCGLGTSVREVLQLSRLTKVFDVYADEQAALST
jgi:anti-sigma B factor antagonist